jgi:hypothetical protein
MPTSRPYTDADLRTEAARQHALSTEDPDFMGISERMEGSKIPSRGDFQWDQLDDADFDTAQRAIDDLLTGAADVSEWAIALGAAGLTPLTEIGIALTTGGYSIAVQIAADPGLTDDAREELIAELSKAITDTAGRVLGCKPVA